MCRLLVAEGDFDASLLFDAAAAMARGTAAVHDSPIRVHPDGWGMAAYKRSCGRWSVHRCTTPIFDTEPAPEIALAKPDLLVIHSRHATRPSTKGAEFTHPIEETNQDVRWYLMHNG